MSTVRTQRVKYFLGKWFYFDTQLSYLDEVETVQMKILYSSLKELTPEERKFLAEKYRVPEKPYIKDAILATRIGCSLEEYKSQRINIEKKFRPIINKYVDLYKDEFSKAMDLSMASHKDF